MLQEKSSNSVKVLSINYEKLILKLKEIAKEIKRRDSKVKKIILFGSFAKGNFTPESDLDILIIVSKAKEKFLFRSENYIDFFKNIPLDINIIVYTEAEVEKFLNQKIFL